MQCQKCKKMVLPNMNFCIHCGWDKRIPYEPEGHVEHQEEEVVLEVKPEVILEEEVKDESLQTKSANIVGTVKETVSTTASDVKERVVQTFSEPKNVVTYDSNANSYFTGGLIGLIGINIAKWIIIAFTLGLALPWAVVMGYEWETKHTHINGKKLIFKGTGGGLFGTYIKWWLLTIVTLGIYAFFIPVRLERWKAKHTHFADSQVRENSYFTGSTLGLIGRTIVVFIVTTITFSLALPWMISWLIKWKEENTVINNHKMRYVGSGGGLFISYIKWILLTLITLGIYGLWIPIKIKKYIVSNINIEKNLDAKAIAQSGTNKIDVKSVGRGFQNIASNFIGDKKDVDVITNNNQRSENRELDASYDEIDKKEYMSDKIYKHYGLVLAILAVINGISILFTRFGSSDDFVFAFLAIIPTLFNNSFSDFYLEGASFILIIYLLGFGAFMLLAVFNFIQYKKGKLIRGVNAAVSAALFIFLFVGIEFVDLIFSTSDLEIFDGLNSYQRINFTSYILFIITLVMSFNYKYANRKDENQQVLNKTKDEIKLKLINKVKIQIIVSFIFVSLFMMVALFAVYMFYDSFVAFEIDSLLGTNIFSQDSTLEIFIVFSLIFSLSITSTLLINLEMYQRLNPTKNYPLINAMIYISLVLGLFYLTAPSYGGVYHKLEVTVIKLSRQGNYLK